MKKKVVMSEMNLDIEDGERDTREMVETPRLPLTTSLYQVSSGIKSYLVEERLMAGSRELPTTTANPDDKFEPSKNSPNSIYRGQKQVDKSPRQDVTVSGKVSQSSSASS